MKEVACGSNHTLLLLETFEDQKLIELGNLNSNQTDLYMLNMINMETVDLKTVKDKYLDLP